MPVLGEHQMGVSWNDSPKTCTKLERVGVKVVVISTEEENSKEWENSLVGYVEGRKPYYLHLKNFLHKTWNPKGRFEVLTRDGGFEDDCEALLEKGPWLIGGRLLLVLCKWRRHLKTERELHDCMPVWIKLRNLPLQCRSSDFLGNKGSMVGNPLYLDISTAEKSRISYARMCVEVSDHRLSEEVTISGTDGSTFTQKIEY